MSLDSLVLEGLTLVNLLATGVVLWLLHRAPAPAPVVPATTPAPPAERPVPALSEAPVPHVHHVLPGQTCKECA